MTEKRMLIVDSEIARKIDENRGDMSYSDFLNFLLDSQFKGQSDNHHNQYVQKEEFDSFVQGMKELLRNFMEFFISYELELGKKPDDEVFNQISQKMKNLGNSAK